MRGSAGAVGKYEARGAPPETRASALSILDFSSSSGLEGSLSTGKRSRRKELAAKFRSGWTVMRPLFAVRTVSKAITKTTAAMNASRRHEGERVLRESAVDCQRRCMGVASFLGWG